MTTLFDQIKQVQTPAYIIDEHAITKNLEIFQRIMDETGCKAILALKAFSTFSVFPVIKKVLEGTTSSSLHEALLAKEEFGKDIHIYSPAFIPQDMSDIITIADYITFNSFSQWRQYQDVAQKTMGQINYGIRLNPEHSETKVDMYNPCQPYSRLGVTKKEFKPDELEGISGFLIHTLCGQNSQALERTLEKVESSFGEYLHQMKWINIGGGHMVTRSDYDVDHLIEVINRFQDKYQVQIIFEPGESIVLNTGYLSVSVIDLIRNEKEIAILDTSAHAHMPDVIEMPYRPNIEGAGQPGDYAYTYRLGGVTCLSGDIIGEYSFKDPLKIGDKLLFNDMSQYTMVKNTTFNGLKLPSICVYRQSNKLDIVKEFGYQDFKNRLS